MHFSEIGNKIKQTRKERGLTQEKLSQLAKISRPTLSKLENGEFGSISFAKFITVLRILGLDLEIVPFNPFKKRKLND